MRQFEVALTEAEFEELERRFPATSKSSNVGCRAIEILKLHFARLWPGCRFEEQSEDSDLQVTRPDGTTLRIEVKGTADRGLAWPKLKVSGQPSYQALIGGMPVYRVTRVYERSPKVFVLTYPDDFELQVEPRWRFKRAAVSAG